MRLESHQPVRFGRPSPVLKHWLAHSEGFRVEGRLGRGVVDRVYGLPGSARTLAVRRRVSGRRVLVPAEAFDEVVPAERLLVVSAPTHEQRRARRRSWKASWRAGGLLVLGCLRVCAWAAAMLAAAAWRAATGAAFIARDAGLTLADLERAARPHVQLLGAACVRLLWRAGGWSRKAIGRLGHAARHEAHVARSLEAVIAVLGQDRAAENGRASEPRRKTSRTGGRARR